MKYRRFKTSQSGYAVVWRDKRWKVSVLGASQRSANIMIPVSGGFISGWTKWEGLLRQDGTEEIIRPWIPPGGYVVVGV